MLDHSTSMCGLRWVVSIPGVDIGLVRTGELEGEAGLSRAVLDGSELAAGRMGVESDAAGDNTTAMTPRLLVHTPRPRSLE